MHTTSPISWNIERWRLDIATAYTIPSSAPFLPSDLEAANFYYGLESKPILVARSDRDAWVPSEGPYIFVAWNPTVGEGRYTEDWAVIEIHPDMINRRNFVGNAIDLGQVAAADFKKLLCPHPANPHSFDYPGDRLHRCHGILSDKDMLNPDPKTKDQDNEPTIMAIQNGNVSGLQVGRVNTIRSVVRRYYEKLPVWPILLARRLWSSVVAGDGRICGLLTGGDGITETSDVTYLSPMDFIIERMKHFGIVGANFFPSADDLA
ncbi:hypothetical protein FOMPIDRAFT_110381 [Fomitopsis schrenkii]|uniref:Uncharacterized protein n=1 Tax=Fomitopsis schrenkii TaxID=2126942 RepID=S8ECR1_FOMSC|nr:hypothetical protein FOMPIDRAFT_110381 [Fomitopsis schrenkii]